jgi:hypothetical protein
MNVAVRAAAATALAVAYFAPSAVWARSDCAAKESPQCSHASRSLSDAQVAACGKELETVLGCLSSQSDELQQMHLLRNSVRLSREYYGLGDARKADSFFHVARATARSLYPSSAAYPKFRRALDAVVHARSAQEFFIDDRALTATMFPD